MINARLNFYKIVFTLLCLAVIYASQSQAYLSDSDAAIYKQAFKKVKANKWQAAEELAAGANDKTLADVITWTRLRYDNNIGFQKAARFIETHPNWPYQNYLQKRAENRIATGDENRALVFLRQNDPQTTKGKLLLLEQSATPAQQAPTIWISESFSSAEQRQFLRDYGQYITPQHHKQRLKTLVARSLFLEADRMKGFLGQDQIAWLNANKAFKRGYKNASLKAVPINMRSEANLVYARAGYHRRRGQHEQAQNLLAQHLNKLDANLPYNYRVWWRERSFQIRKLIKDRNYQQAYRLANKHQQPKNTAGFAEAEFLAGWLSLQQLNQPKQSLDHFVKLTRGVTYPISKSRGQYWQGRALAAMGKPDAARYIYDQATQHYVTFYGQLASQALGKNPNIELVKNVDIPPIKAFLENDLARAAIQLSYIGEHRRIAPFLQQLYKNETNPRKIRDYKGLARRLGRFDLSVSLSKQAKNQGVVTPSMEFPVLSIPAFDGPEPALVHAVIRQESVFSPTAKSHVGARGLMQLMPGTARLEARTLGLPYSLSRLTSDPEYNIKLGSAHLRRALERFDGSYPLAIAAYNAGGGNVEKWVKAYGDPRTGEITILDWMELIPFKETRNYVQRVLEGLEIYRLRLEHYPTVNTPVLPQTAWCSYSCRMIRVANN